MSLRTPTVGLDSIRAGTERNILDRYTQYQSYFRFFMVDEDNARSLTLPPQEQWFIIAETGGSAETTASVERVELETLGGIDKETGIGMATKFSMEILQANGVSVLDDIYRAARDRFNIDQFLQLPYFLELTFRVRDPESQDPLGWQPLNEYRWVWPLIIKTTETQVSHQGSKTTFDARFFADLANSNELSRLRRSVSITAGTVQDFFDKLADRLSQTDSEFAECEEKYQFGDVYKFEIDPRIAEQELLPTDHKNNKDRQYNGGVKWSPEPEDITPESAQAALDKATQLNTEIVQLRKAGQSVPRDLEAARNAAAGKFSQINEALKAQNNDTSDSDSRVISFHRGEKIENIVHQILMSTELYQTEMAKNNSAKETNEGTVNNQKKNTETFYRILTDVRLGNYNPILRTYNKVITYSIVEYQTTTPMPSPVDSLINRTSLSDYAGVLRKHYNYNFTGLNNEILNFDLTFNFHWYLALANQAGQIQLARNEDESAIDAETAKNRSQDLYCEPPKSFPDDNIPTGGMIQANPQDILANIESLNTTGRNIISSLFEQVVRPIHRDLIEVEMEIRGDPYWLEPDPMPNIAGSVPGYRNRTGAVNNNSSRSQTYFLFTTYFPEPYNEATGKMPAATNKTVINGVYFVRRVTNIFDQGKFTQRISALRDVRFNINSVQVAADGRLVIVRPESESTTVGRESEDAAPKSNSESADRLPEPKNDPFQEPQVFEPGVTVRDPNILRRGPDADRRIEIENDPFPEPQVFEPGVTVRDRNILLRGPNGDI